MTARSIRRLAERRAKKLTGKTAQPSAPITQPEAKTDFAIDGAEEPLETHPESPAPAIIPAAAANAHLTAETSPLTGELTLLPTTEAAPYAQLLRDYQTELQPIGFQETELVQTLAETLWRARRLRALESALFAQGRVTFAAQFAEHNPAIRDSLIDVHTFLTYEKQLRGLQLQESRLSRRADKASAELRTLQQDRQKRADHAHRQQLQNPPAQSESAGSSAAPPISIPPTPNQLASNIQILHRSRACPRNKRETANLPTRKTLQIRPKPPSGLAFKKPRQTPFMLLYWKLHELPAVTPVGSAGEYPA